VAASAATEVVEEEEYDRCDGANPRRRPDDALLSLAADGILIRVGEQTKREVRKYTVGRFETKCTRPLRKKQSRTKKIPTTERTSSCRR
jgi:hypothetical protein